MPAAKFRMLLIEDNVQRIETLRGWLPDSCLMVSATSAGRAMGILRRDSGDVYGAVMLDHDLHEQAATETDLTLSGSNLVKTLIALLSVGTPILVLSMNPAHAPKVAAGLKLAGFDVVRVPFADMDRSAFLQWLRGLRNVVRSPRGR